MESASYYVSKVDLTPRRHHGYAVLLFIMGTLFPPLAVAARFGIGKDFWINLLLTICGYIPGHGHNFYIQNIRNNKNHRRTPKWAQRYGLVDTSEIQRKERKSQWAAKYNDRLPTSTLEGQPYEEGQQPGSSMELVAEGNDTRQRKPQNGDLWRPDEETYYNAEANASSSSGRWRYPANFDDAELPTSQKRKKKKEKKDRWARTEDAYSMSEEIGRKKRSKRKRKSSRASVSEETVDSRDSNTREFPEDPEGGLYQSREQPTPQQNRTTTDDVFDHQF